MSKIKNTLKIVGVSALTILGADEVLAQDITTTQIDRTKNDSEIFLKDTKPHGTLKVNIIPNTIKSDTLISENRIYSKNGEITTAGSGILGTKYDFILPLTPNSKIGLDSLFHSNQGEIYFEVLDGKKGLENILKYLSPENHSDGKDIAFKKYVKNKLLEDAKKNPSDSLSLRLLNKAVKDGILDVQADILYVNGEWQIKDGIYVLSAKSKEIAKGDTTFKANSVPIILDIKTFNNEKFKLPVNGFKSFFLGNNLNISEGKYKNQFALNIGNSRKNFPEEKTDEKDKKHTSVIVGVHAGQVNGLYLGLQHGKIGILGSYSMGLYENLKTIRGPESSTGMHGEVSTNNSHWRAPGLSGEYNKNYFIGLGTNFWNYDYEKEVKILNKDGTMKRKAEPLEHKSAISANFYAGKNFKNNKIGLIAGYDTKKGFYGGTRYRFGK